MTQLYAQASQQGIWTCLGSPQSAAFALAQSLTVTYGDGTQDALAAHVPAVTSAGTTQVDRTGAVWLLYVVHGDPTLRIVREMDQGTIAGSYAALARVLADRVVPYQPDSGQAQSGTSAQSLLPLTVTNTSSTQSIGGSLAVPVASSSSDYVVQCHLSGSTATAVWNALADKTSFTDLQVLFAGAEIDADIDQQTNGAWSSSTITLWFRLQRPIAALGIDQGYQLRMGGGLRALPPRSWANIYPFSDDFLGSSVSASLWTTLGSPTLAVSGSLCTLTPTSNAAHGLIGKTVFGTGYQMRLYGQLLATGDATHIAWTAAEWVTGAATAAVPADWVQNEPDLSAFFFARQHDGSSYGAVTPTSVSADGANHSFSVARTSSGAAVVGVDGAAAVSTSDRLHTGSAYPSLLAAVNAGGTAQVVADWVKVRPYCSSEPTVSAGALQSAGGLRWEPVVDSTGSVLIAPSGDPIMALVAAA